MSSSTRVYVGRLSSSVRDTDIQKFFRNYGKIREILLKDGYGFVEFDEKRDAEDAVYEMNGKELCGERLIVEHAKPPGSGRGRGSRGGYDRYSAPGRSGGYGVRGGGFAGFRSSSGERYRGSRPPAVPRTEYRVVVDNLSSRTSWQDLKDYMRKGGEVIYADAHKRRANQGVVEFASAEDMRRAIEKLDDTELNGRRLTITEDMGHSRSRRRSHSRSSSRSRSHSRSRSRSRDYRKRSRSRSRDSRDRSHSGSRDNRKRSRSRSHSRENDNNRSRSPSRGNDNNRSRSPSRGNVNNRSRSPSRGNDNNRSRSPSRGNERNASRSRSPEKKNNSRSRSPNDRSRSRSPEANAAS